MASTTAPTGLSRATAAGKPPLRQLWQVPTFLLGLLAFVAVGAIRPPWHLGRDACGQTALAQLRERLTQPDLDADRALVLGAEAVQRAHTPQEAGEAHFLLGSVYVRLAEASGPGKGRDPWREARTHLEQARALGVPDDERARLDYRLGKAWAATGEPPQAVIDALKGSIDEGAEGDVDAVRGYGLLAEAYLKLPQPDAEAALAATVKQIDRSVVEDVLLGPARLRRGELLLRLGHPEEAEEVLKNVGAKAPPAVIAPARRLRVRILEQQERWADAAAVWRDIRDDREAPPEDRPAVLYHLGLCLRNGPADQRDEAGRTWEECLGRDDAGDEAAAAALGLAELRLRQGPAGVGAALSAFGRAVLGVTAPGDWHNALVPLPRARGAFEAGCQATRSAGAYEASLRLADLYQCLAVPGRAQELKGEAAGAWAAATREQARRAAGEARRKLYGDAEALLRQAGAAYLQAADAQTTPAEQAERLWSAGNSFLDGRDAARAARAFARFREIARQPDLFASERFGGRLAEACYKLGQALREADDLAGAETAFKEAAQGTRWKSRYVYRARYERALAQAPLNPQTNSRRWTDQAKEELEQNLVALRRAGEDRDEEARENTLYALGDLYFERREQFEMNSHALSILEEALRDFPNNPQALRARYELAECYQDHADQRQARLPVNPSKDANLDIQQKVMQEREKAISNWQEVARVLEARSPRDKNDDELLRYALFTAADLRFLAGGYAEAGAAYEALAERYRDSPEDRTRAVCQVLRSYWHAANYPRLSDDSAAVRGYWEKVRRAKDELRAGLARRDPQNRAAFERWLNSFELPPTPDVH
jgi:tetratricopeptide (TPR) repeat protein